MSLSKGKGIATSPSPTPSIHSTSFNLCQASTKYSRAEQMTILSGFFDKQNSALAETLQDETTAKETPSHTIGKHGLWHRFAQSLVRAAYKRVDPASYQQHKERVSQGTSSSEKALGYAQSAMSVAKHPEVTRAVQSYRNLIKAVKLEQRTADYYKSKKWFTRDDPEWEEREQEDMETRRETTNAAQAQFTDNILEVNAKPEARESIVGAMTKHFGVSCKDANDFLDLIPDLNFATGCCGTVVPALALKDNTSINQAEKGTTHPASSLDKKDHRTGSEKEGC